MHHHMEEESEQQCECGCGGECECECHEHEYFERHFQTKAEMISELEAYLHELKLEVQAVEEHLTDLRK
jgi:hypothetical protein